MESTTMNIPSAPKTYEYDYRPSTLPYCPVTEKNATTTEDKEIKGKTLSEIKDKVLSIGENIIKQSNSFNLTFGRDTIKKLIEKNIFEKSIFADRSLFQLYQKEDMQAEENEKIAQAVYRQFLPI
ncbi:MAG: hypothetical protein AAGE99_03395, partial [Chlamydiota bacterium]